MLKFATIHVLLLVFLTFTSWSQDAALRIQSSDSSQFFVNISGFESPDSANSHFDFFFNQANKISGVILVKKDSLNEINFDIKLTPGYIEIYELSQVGNNIGIVPFIKTLLEVDSIHHDSSSNYLFPLPPIKPIENIPTQVGCSPPTTNFGTLFQKVKSVDFAFQKEQLITSIVSNHCLKADQIKKLVDQIDYEDKKLEMVKKAYDHTYDQNNFYSLRSLFYLEKYQKDFDHFLEVKNE